MMTLNIDTFQKVMEIAMDHERDLFYTRSGLIAALLEGIPTEELREFSMTELFKLIQRNRLHLDSIFATAREMEAEMDLQIADLMNPGQRKTASELFNDYFKKLRNNE